MEEMIMAWSERHSKMLMKSIWIWFSRNYWRSTFFFPNKMSKIEMLTSFFAFQNLFSFFVESRLESNCFQAKISKFPFKLIPATKQLHQFHWNCAQHTQMLPLIKLTYIYVDKIYIFYEVSLLILFFSTCYLFVDFSKLQIVKSMIFCSNGIFFISWISLLSAIGNNFLQNSTIHYYHCSLCVCMVIWIYVC